MEKTLEFLLDPSKETKGERDQYDARNEERSGLPQACLAGSTPLRNSRGRSSI